MSFDLVNGYKPRTDQQLKKAITDNVNKIFGTTYTTETITGTNFYKYFYAGVQLIMQAENATAQLSNKLTDYITTTKQIINLPRSTVDGFLNYLYTEFGLIGSFKPIDKEADAGKPKLAIDIDKSREDYEEIKQKIFKAMHQNLCEGLYWYDPETEATEQEERGTVIAENGQAFNYQYEIPTELNLDVKITCIISSNNKNLVLNENQVKEIFTKNFNLLYRLGFAFEPDTYMEIKDVPFAGDVIVEWKKTDGGGLEYERTILKTEYNEKIIIKNLVAEVKE